MYDNALLVSVLSYTYKLVEDKKQAAAIPDQHHAVLFRETIEETLAYVAREMTSPDGGFYSAQDADSEGVEGKFYVWNPELLEDALSEVDRERDSTAYGITADGNFEGESIPTAPADPLMRKSSASASPCWPPATSDSDPEPTPS